MRATTLLLTMVVIAATFVSTAPSQTVAVQLRHNGESSAVGVLAASSKEQQQQQQRASVGADATTSAPTTPSKKKTIGDKARAAIDKYHELPPAARYAMGAGGLVLGLVLALFGYQFLRTTIFVVCGFVCGSLLYSVLEATLDADLASRTAIIYISSAAFALLGGLVFLYYIKLAFVFVGASLGIMLAVVLDPVALRFIWPAQPVLNLYLWMAVFGAVTGVLVLCLEKPIFVISTAVVGSFIFILSIAAFTGGLAVLSTFKAGDPVPDQAWFFFGGFVACVVVAVSVQFCYTANSASDDAHKQYKSVK